MIFKYYWITNNKIIKKALYSLIDVLTQKNF